MIIRLLGGGQYHLDEAAVTALNQLDSSLEATVESGNAEAFADILRAMHAYVRAHGKAIPADELTESVLIVPDVDSTIDQVRRLLTDDAGLIPG